MSKRMWAFESTISESASKSITRLFNIEEGQYINGYVPLILSETCSACTVYKNNDRFTAIIPDGDEYYITVDKPKRTIAIQDKWWHKCQYQVEVAGNSTKLIGTVYNSAVRFRWVANLMFYGKKKTHHKTFNQFVKNLCQAVKLIQG